MSSFLLLLFFIVVLVTVLGRSCFRLRLCWGRVVNYSWDWSWFLLLCRFGLLHGLYWCLNLWLSWLGVLLLALFALETLLAVVVFFVVVFISVLVGVGDGRLLRLFNRDWPRLSDDRCWDWLPWWLRLDLDLWRFRLDVLDFGLLGLDYWWL